MVKEETSEWPIKVGTIYKLTNDKDELSEVTVAGIKSDEYVEWISSDHNYHCRYSLQAIDGKTVLEYCEWTDQGEIEEPFTQDVLAKLKFVLERDKKFNIFNISKVPFEEIHNTPGSQQTLATKDDLITNNIDALTKGTLSPGDKWDWHEHDMYDEVGIVLKGTGKFFWQNEIVEYKPEDVIIIPADSLHKFEAGGKAPSEFYFIRIKV